MGRDQGWTVHVPRDLQERALAVSRHTERLSTELRRSPTVVELADALGCTVEQAVEAIDAGENYQLASLDAPIARPTGGRDDPPRALRGLGHGVRILLPGPLSRPSCCGR
jgi:DNA-directed RNA polymerase specialized sigma subunit